MTTEFWYYTPLHDENGQIIGAFHLAIDIPGQPLAWEELALGQEALRQSPKMEAMRSLTGGPCVSLLRDMFLQTMVTRSAWNR